MIKSFVLYITMLVFAQNGFSQTKDSTLKKSQDSLPHATFYFYRAHVPLLEKSVKKIPVYINDSLIHDLKANTCVIIKIYKEGRFTVAVDKKRNTETDVKVKFGKEYFFRCDGLGGLLNFKTTIDLVPEAQGKKETGVLTTD